MPSHNIYEFMQFLWFHTIPMNSKNFYEFIEIVWIPRNIMLSICSSDAAVQNCTRPRGRPMRGPRAERVEFQRIHGNSMSS